MVLAAAVLAAAGLGCDLTGCGAFDDGACTVVFYNTQNLFDDVDDGSEYAEFDPGTGRWTGEHYHKKLEAVGKVLRDTAARDADLVALAEIENEGVLKRLNEGWLAARGYHRLIAAVPPGGAAGLGLLSRLPVRQARLHRPDHPGARFMLEVELEFGGGPLTLFVCHWKSKSPDAEASEPLRILAARLLEARLSEIRAASPGRPVLVVGDLNESADESRRVAGRYPTALSLAGTADPAGLVVAGLDQATAGAALHSPWLAGADFPGSYAYRAEWETIDQALLEGSLVDGTGLEFEGFNVIHDDFLLNESGYPRAWKPEGGYSDHLPVMVRLRMR